MAEELVSVVIPAYNAERFLGETLESVARQTHRALEVFVVDDGSKDGTAALADAFARRDPRVRVIRQANAGVSSARNRGAAEAKGRYLAFLDADDVWRPGILAALLRGAAARPDVGLVHCDFIEFDSATGTFSPEAQAGDEGLILDHLLLGNDSGRRSLIAIGTFLVTAEAFRRSGGFDPDLSNCADLGFYLQVARHYSIARVAEVGLHYRLLPNSMHCSIPVLEKDTLTVFAKADRGGLFKDPVFRRRCYGNMYWMLGGSWWKNGRDRIRGARYLAKALFCYPPIALRVLRKISGP